MRNESFAELFHSAPFGEKSMVFRDETLRLRDVAKRKLKGLGAAEGGRLAVAIRTGRGANHIAWMLACSEEGIVFVPMDPSNPDERDEALAREVGVVAVIERDGRFRRMEYPLPWPAECEYGAFTSGSGGSPKCALLPRGALARVARSQANLFGYSSDMACGWLLSPGWDASLSDVAAPIAAGAAVIPFEGETSNFRQTRRWLKESGVAGADIPVAYLPLLSSRDAPALRTIVYGGDLAGEDALAKWSASGVKLFNCYGPTEATICASARLWRAGADPRDIGEPLAGATLRLSDGEIVIGGANVMLGYANAQSPLRTENGELVFPTGDRGETGEDGELLFMGRLSRSRKVDGVFVNPEEIETAARASGAVDAACVERAGRFVLHAVWDGGDESFRANMAKRLSKSVFSKLRIKRSEALPKLANGKTNLNAPEFE